MAQTPQQSLWINNRYHLHTKLGQGGMGEVYHATDRLTRQSIAFKRVTVSPDNLAFNSKVNRANKHLALAQEFKILASLRHPHIISVLDYGFDETRLPYFAMEYLEGATAITAAAQGATFDVKINFILDILQALVYLHQHGIVHRDLKPENVLVANAGLKVVDFGLSLVTKGSEAVMGETAGTIPYMAPELFQGHPASGSSDLYAVGMMAYELLAESYPFERDNLGMLITQIVTEPIDMTPIQANFDVTVVLERLVAKSPDERYHSAREVIRDLCAAIGRAVPPETEAIRESFLQAAKFVGRQVEIDRLYGIWGEVTSGKTRTWLVSGESGVGKSRLLDELRFRVLVDGGLVVFGQAASEGRSPYQLWRAVLRHLSLYSTLSEEQAALLKPLVPDLAQVIGREVGESQLQQTQPPLFETVSAIFKQQSQPTLVLLEDLQWAGDESLELLDYLSQNLDDLPLLFIGSYRDEERPDLPSRFPHAQHMKLSRLNEDGIVAFSTSMLGETGKQAAVIDLLKQETEGNAFFLVEVIRALAEEAGRLDQIGEGPLPDQILAEGVLSVIRRHLSRVPQWGYTLLQLAGVAGRQIDEPVLSRLSQDVDFEHWLATCANVLVLEFSNNQWRFAHDKLRETLLADLSEAERLKLHRQLAAVYEVQAAEQADEVDVTRWQRAFEHYLQANRYDDAARSYDRITDYLFGWGEAQQVIDQRLMWQSTLSDKERIAANYHYLGAAYLMVQALDEAIEVLQAGVIHAKTHQIYYWLAKMLLNLATACQYRGDFEQSSIYLEQVQGLQIFFDDETIAVQTKARLTLHYIHTGRLQDSVKVGREALEKIDRIPLTERYRSEFAIKANIAQANFHLGNLDDALNEFCELVDMTVAVNNKSVEVSLRNNVAAIMSHQGRFEEALKESNLIIEQAKAIGDKRVESMTHINRGDYLRSKGDYDAALHAIESGMTIANEIGLEPIETLALGEQGLIYITRQQKDDGQRAIASLKKAIKKCQGTVPYECPRFRSYLAFAYMMNDELENTTTVLSEGL